TVGRSDQKVCLGRGVCGIVSEEQEFMYQYLLKHENSWKSIEQGGTFTAINSDDIKSFKIYVPTKAESTKIAEFLSLVDERIEQQRQLVEALKRYKRGLFLRLYDDCDKKEYKISEIGKYCSTGTLSKDDVDEFGKYPCILYGELFTKYNEIIKQVSSSTNITPTYLSGNNEVLFPSSTTADALSLIFPSSLKIENIFLGGDLFVIKLYGKFDSDFISYLLNYVYKTKLARYTQGITIIHLHYTDIKDQILDIPDINTQHKVAGIVNIIDMLIDKHTDKLNAQIELKKGFLQQMFI
ncbi:MAG: restriction endonuclease subunit S, partial [Alphaproteobacteria bacterium]|nr:restriction endonuclease subunit S [Alphaproteobacteria bacterium]